MHKTHGDLPRKAIQKLIKMEMQKQKLQVMTELMEEKQNDEPKQIIESGE